MNYARKCTNCNNFVDMNFASPVCSKCHFFSEWKPKSVEIDGTIYTVETANGNTVTKKRKESIKTEYQALYIKDVIFNNPATIVFWSDGTKTVVKAQGKERFNREKGLAMAIAKRSLGNEGNYYNEFKKWLDK